MSRKPLSIKAKKSSKLDSLFAEYATTNKPIQVSIRSLMPEMPYNVSRFTHGVHFYPAKLIPQIPSLFLEELRLEKEAVILDPFCGSGTVMLETILRGYNAIGADANPLARLISKVKTTRISTTRLDRIATSLASSLRNYKGESWPDVVNIKYWYSERIAKDLARIKHFIEQFEDKDIQKLLWVSLSQAARKLSQCDLRVVVPVKLKLDRYSEGHTLYKKAEERLNWLKQVDVLDFFTSVTSENISLLRSLHSIKPLGKVNKIYANACSDGAKSLTAQADKSIDLIVTSPPYAGAQKYIRASSLGLGWTGLCKSSDLRDLEDQNIGREHFSNKSVQELPPIKIDSIDDFIEVTKAANPLRAKILSSYFHEMENVIKNCKRLLSSSGQMILVVGPNMVCGNRCDTPNMLLDIAIRNGLKPAIQLVDEIRSRGLMTRRNKTASTISCEHIFLLRHG